MPLDRAFRFSIYVVVALAGFALGAGDLLSPTALGIFLVALAGTWWLHDALGPRARMGSWKVLVQQAWRPLRSL